MISNSSFILQSSSSCSSSFIIPSSQSSSNSTVICCNDRLQIQRQQLLDIISNIQKDKNRLYFTVGDRNKRVYNYQRDGKTENLKFKRLFRLIQILLKQEEGVGVGATVVTVRDLFYRDVELFHNQNVVRNLLQKDLYFVDLELFNVYSSSKGLYYLNSVSIQLELIGGCGSSRSSNLNQTEYNCIPFKYTQLKLSSSSSSSSSSKLMTVLIVEKVAVFTSLLGLLPKDDDLLLLTPRGFADTCFIKFVNCLLEQKNVKIRILFLVDADPYGIHILLDIQRKLLSDCSSVLMMMKWIGLDLMELIEYKDLLLRMNKCDYKRAILVLSMINAVNCSTDLSLELLLQLNVAVVVVQRMMWYGVKAEIDVLHEINESDYGNDGKKQEKVEVGLVEYVRRKIK